MAGAKTSARRYVPLEDDLGVGEVRSEEPGKETQSEGARASMLEVFGAGGFLEKCMKGGFDRSVVSSDYEYRAAQLEMAELVDDAFETHHHAIVEAGTGTGKTLAYLIPAICSGRRVVISTATKSLQEQLFQKDIPF
ncbi:MAG TPA: DEAD/DEAH box helicase, partial [Candidatus Dormibacteraeota bacterium]|nr:DEAD/DEAH box helicase [Candidatus Dormibacteraeota bacterium]